jgi:hypothetical protein
MERFAGFFTFRRSASLQKIERGLRLRHVIWACALFGVLITELVVLGASYALWSSDQIRRIDEETLLMLKANVDTASFLSVDETIRMGERITTFSDVRGGAIYNRMGEQVATFGEAIPGLSMRTFQREGIRYLRSQDKAYLDVYYPMELTGLANPVVLRVDVHNIPAILQQRLQEKARATFSVAFISALAVVFLLNITIVRPILALRKAILKATDNPDTAHSVLLNWNRGDEFGEVSKALDMLFTTVSVVYQEDLSAWQEIRQHSAFPVLTYDAAWHLINANTAALTLFNCTTHNELAERHSCFIRQSNENGTSDVAPKQITNNENTVKTINVVTPQGIKRCIMNAIVTHKRSGGLFRTAIELVDVTRLAAQIESMKSEAALMTGDNHNMKRRLAEMRALFQGCLILLTHANQDSEYAGKPAPSVPAAAANNDELRGATRPVTLTDRIVNAWFSEARFNHLIDSSLAHGVLPPVYGRPEEIEAIFMQALMAIYSRATYEKPFIRIKAEKLENHKALFEIWWEKPKENAKLRKPDETLSAGARLSLASLQQSLKTVGGNFRNATETRLSFSLDAASFEEVPFNSDSSPSTQPGVEDELRKILDL